MNVFASQKNRRDKNVNGTLLIGNIVSDVKIVNDQGVNGIFYDVADQNGLLYSCVPVLNSFGSGNDVGQSPSYKKHSSVLMALMGKNSTPIIMGGLQFAAGLLPGSLINAENIAIQNGENKIELAAPKSEVNNNNSLLIEAKGNMIFKSQNGKFKFISENKTGSDFPLNGVETTAAITLYSLELQSQLLELFTAIQSILISFQAAIAAANALGTNATTLPGYTAFMGVLQPALTNITSNISTINLNNTQTEFEDFRVRLRNNLTAAINKKIELPNK